MIHNHNTNLLYLSDLLPKKYPIFYKAFSELLKQYKIAFALLEGTKDVWARDYMPIQYSPDAFSKFKYAPSYLNTEHFKKTITDSLPICRKLEYKVDVGSVKLDGGNVIAYGNKAIVCDRVIAENPDLSIKELTEELRWGFRTNHIIYIPTPPDDLFGHADGTVRFIDNKNVLINDYAEVDSDYKKKLIKVLEKAKLNIHLFPYNPYQNNTEMDATGVYINFLHMKKIIFVPAFDMKEDDIAVNILAKYFKKEKIVKVPCSDLAKGGGLLNCISWAIEKPKEPYTELDREIDRDLICMGLD